MADSEGETRRDAALTVVVLVVVAVAAWTVEAPVTPAVLVVGVGSALLAELLLSLRAERVRAVWARREVQAAAVVVAIAGGVGLAFLVGPWVLTALVAALLTYLTILGASAVWPGTGSGPND